MQWLNDVGDKIQNKERKKKKGGDRTYNKLYLTAHVTMN